MKNQIIECDNKKYVKIEGYILTGDLYYLTFFQKVFKMENIDYGAFNPNELGAVKVEPLRKAKIKKLLNAK